MSEQKVSDEMLMAYADGELEGAERADIAALANADPAIAARIAGFARSATLARDVFAPIHAEPVPADLIAAVTGSGKPSSRQDNGWLRRAMMPVAAMLVLIAGVGGYLAGRGAPGETGGGFIDAATGPVLLERLARTGSGETIAVSANGHDFEVLATGTYETDAGFCRIYDAASTSEALRGVACTDGSAWSVPVTVRQGEGYQLASDAGTMAIEGFLDSVGAGGDIGADAEDSQIAGGWARE